MDTELLGSRDSRTLLGVCQLSFPSVWETGLWTQEHREWSWGEGCIFQLSWRLGRNWPKCCCFSILLPKPGLWALLGITVCSPSLRVNESLGKLFSSICVCWSGARCWGVKRREVQISQEASEWLPNSHPGQVPWEPTLPTSVPTLVLAVGGRFMWKSFYLCLCCLPKQIVSA